MPVGIAGAYAHAGRREGSSRSSHGRTMKIGSWVLVSDGREGLITRYAPLSGFFLIEFEDGSETMERPEYLTLIRE